LLKARSGRPQRRQRVPLHDGVREHQAGQRALRQGAAQTVQRPRTLGGRVPPGGVATNFAVDVSGATRWMYHTFLNRFLDSSDKGGARLAHFIAGRPGDAWLSGEFYDPSLTIGRTHK